MRSTSSSPSETSAILCQGFGSLVAESKQEDKTLPLQWYCPPHEWKLQEGKREGRNGKFQVVPGENSTSLVLYPPAKKDYWRKTYYQPLLIKDDAPFLHASISNEVLPITISTDFALCAHEQFDQGGIMIRYDSDYWLKTGIEVVDGLPRLSCVVTNEYSDWSTQPWSKYEQQEDGVTVWCTIRVHCLPGCNFVVEAKAPGDGASSWSMIRICSLHPTDADTPLKVGVFGACPQDQMGNARVTFSNFCIVRGSDFEHNADGNLE